MQHKENIEGQPYQQRERIERRQESTSVVSLRVNWHTVHQVSNHDAPEEARENTAHENHPIPEAAPAETIMLTAKLERCTTYDECKEYQEHLRVKTAQHCGIPDGEGCEQATSGGDEPDLVGIPEGANRVHNHTPLAIVLAQEREQHTNTIVKAFQEEKACQQHTNHYKPEYV